MVVKLSELKEYRLADFKLMEKWENDDEIKAFISPRRSVDPLPYVGAEMLMKHSISNPKKRLYFIMVDGIKVGVMSIIQDFPLLKSKGKHTAWISLYIGDHNYLRKGIASTAMALLEVECIALGYESIELGVFGFNEKAQNLYEKFGYEKIAELEKFVYFQGIWHRDIRMLKALKNAL